MFLVAAAFHTFYFIHDTFKYEDFGGKTAYYVKGSVYTEAAMNCKRKHPEITSDAAMLELCFEGLEGKMQAWSEDSIKTNVYMLIISYGVLVLFFVATVSLLCEVLVLKYTKSHSKLQGPKTKAKGNKA